jgi:uncharacterized membrane protein
VHCVMKARLPLALLVVALAPLAPPFLAAGHPLAALLIRGFFSRLCHQNPARSFLVDGSPIAVCARCLGIYCGVVLGALLRLRTVPARRWLAGALLINMLDVTIGTLQWYGNLPLLRFSLGLLLGIGIGAVLFFAQAELPDQLSANADGFHPWRSKP